MESLEEFNAELQTLQASQLLLQQRLLELEGTDVNILKQERLNTLDSYLAEIPPRVAQPGNISMHDFLQRQKDKWESEPEVMRQMEKTILSQQLLATQSSISYVESEISFLEPIDPTGPEEM